MSEDISRLKEAEKANFESERAGHRRHHHHPHHRGHGWLPGLILIVLGTIFLLENTTNLHLNNWWALFLLIPAFFTLANALRSYRLDGRFSRSVRRSLVGGLILSLLAGAFLLEVELDLIWPLFLIIAGVGALLGSWFD